MKFKAKKVIGGLLVATMALSSMTFANLAVISPITVLAAESSTVSIKESNGWFESAYAKWAPVSGTAQYRAYVKKSNGSYTQLDDQLIRSYGSYWRADAVGLAAGSYSLKIEAYGSDGNLIASSETGDMSVKSYDRSGSAFSSDSKYKTGSGAYNDDGTLKSTAQVIYVTPENAKTVQAEVISNAKGGTTTYTGFQNIVYGLQKGYDLRGFDFRIVGTIDADDMDAFGSSAEGLQVKGKSPYAQMNMTIEGIGEDAAIKNFGILIRNAGNIEIRNFGIMLCMDDALSLDTANSNIWIHNMDCFYGNTGGDADQAKGDGTMDVKGKSTHVTFSYNHFWDNGKSSLCGMKSEETSSLITYHHNWFDHSDSRHPRIRTMSVHVYNNYFDSNAKYGVGMTMGGSAFVENNYYKDVTKPMMISGQGTDKSGAGTFSGETGGVIKAYNNKFTFDKVSSSKLSYINQDKSATSFDAIEVSSRNEKVGSEYKALSGGTTYNNFDTSWDLGVKSVDPVDSVPAIVTANAGRMGGGDFPADRSSYSIINDATSYSVDSKFKSDMAAYKSSIVSFGGTVKGATIVTTEKTTATTETTTETTTKATTTTETTTKKATTTTEKATETTTKKATTTETTTKKVTTTETTTEATTQAPAPTGNVAMGTYNLNSSTVSGKTATYANMAFDVRSVEDDCVKLRSSNTITFKVAEDCVVTAEVAGKGLVIGGTTTGTGTVSVKLSKGSYTIKGAASGSNSSLSKLTFAKAATTTTTEKATEATTKATTTTEKVTTTTAKPTTTETTTKATTTTTETTTEATTQAPAVEGSISVASNEISVKMGESASIKVSASGDYYLEQEGASWWLHTDGDYLNVWGSNSDKRLTSGTKKFSIDQWCGLEDGYTFTLTAHLVDDPSICETIIVTVLAN